MEKQVSTKLKIRRTRAQWQVIMDEFAQSELGVHEFCLQKDLAYSSFAKWRSLLKQKNDATPVSFIPLPALSSTGSNTWCIELDLGGGVVLRLKQN